MTGSSRLWLRCRSPINGSPMKVSLNFIVRIAGMLALAYVGSSIGRALSDPQPDAMQIFATQLLMLAGAGLGLLVTPQLTIDPLTELLRRARVVPLTDILLTAGGALGGLLFAVLLTAPISLLPQPYNQFAPLAVALVLSYIGGMTVAARKRDIADALLSWRRSAPSASLPPAEQSAAPAARRYLLDTSAIIDGRIAAVVKTGFVEGTLVVPSFVLTELQDLADSGDELRRSKGRRGLELLNEMQKHSPLPVEILNVDVSGAVRVDDKLVILARQFQSPIITNDFNLNRVAGLQGITVLSLNQLSDAVRPPVSADQRMQIMIRSEGNSRQQGVGYLEDGTPVFVEDARHLIGRNVEVVVMRWHQTQTGRVVFAQLAPASEVVENPLS
jgi:uncharacterized protein YacL